MSICQIIMSTYQIIKSTCQIIMLTSQIHMVYFFYSCTAASKQQHLTGTCNRTKNIIFIAMKRMHRSFNVPISLTKRVIVNLKKKKKNFKNKQINIIKLILCS
jgi:hypothetical protein